MKFGKVALEKLKKPENSIETWRQKVKDDPDAVRKLLEPPLPVAAVWPISARQALEEYDQEQRDSLISQQKEHDQKQALREAKDSAITKRTLNWTAIGVLVGCVALFLTYIQLT